MGSVTPSKRDDNTGGMVGLRLWGQVIFCILIESKIASFTHTSHCGGDSNRDLFDCNTQQSKKVAPPPTPAHPTHGRRGVCNAVQSAYPCTPAPSIYITLKQDAFLPLLIQTAHTTHFSQLNLTRSPTVIHWLHCLSH